MKNWLTPEVEPEEEEVVGGDKPPTRLLDMPHLLVKDEGSWRERGACYRRPDLTHLFFGELPDGRTARGNSGKVRLAIVNEAKKVCVECTVRKECYRFARQNNIGHGVWGGVDFFMSKADKREGRTLPDDID